MAIALAASTPAVIQANIQGKSNTAIANVSRGVLNYKGHQFQISASKHTPRGSFKLAKAIADGPQSTKTIAFLTIPIENTPIDNPQYELHKKAQTAGSQGGGVCHSLEQLSAKSNKFGVPANESSSARQVARNIQSGR